MRLWRLTRHRLATPVRRFAGRAGSTSIPTGRRDDVPEERIRQRYDTSRRNLVRLLPHLAELAMLDNSRERDPAAGEPPAPILLLHAKSGRIVDACPLSKVPTWAKPIVQAAIRLY